MSSTAKIFAKLHYKPIQKKTSLKIKFDQSILIIGGGPTGVELAGARLTLVHKGARLLEFVGAKAEDKTLNWLKSKNVVVKLEQSKIYQTSNGGTIEADCHFLCIGKPLASAWLKETVLKNDLDGQGRIKVDERLRVKGRNNIFAIGDVTDIPEIKQGFLAQQQLEVVVKNLNLPFLTISGRIPGFIKSRDLFVGKTRKQMGLNPVHI
ncbi:Apoptosis-inducing factor-like A [Glycine soja]|uniref:FAD/NAD(P)-binding domain-containing protein n=2 Tax=Glycine subgen. Soja TaxID=1462606 RepID=A0A0R0EH76_SOYBN|nr:Apoptosis-inducing factor-like A [Glycine soja]